MLRGSSSARGGSAISPSGVFSGGSQFSKDLYEK